MGHYRCCVGTCDNNRRYADILIVSSNKASVICPRFPKHNIKRKIWVKLISKGRADFEPGCCSRVCSVHFPDDKLTSLNSDLTLLLTMQDNREKETKYAQVQRRKSSRKRPTSSEVTNSSKGLF